MVKSSTPANLESAFKMLSNAGYVRNRFDFGGELGDMWIFEAGDGWHVACLADHAQNEIDLRFGVFTDDFMRLKQFAASNTSRDAAPSLMYISATQFIPPSRDFREGLEQNKQPPETWLVRHIESAIHPFLLGDKTYEYCLNLLDTFFVSLPLWPWSHVALLRLAGLDQQFNDFAAHWRERVKGSFVPTDTFDEFITRVRSWTP